MPFNKDKPSSAVKDASSSIGRNTFTQNIQTPAKKPQGKLSSPGRIAEGKILSTQPATEFRPRSSDPATDKTLKIYRDDLYRLRKSFTPAQIERSEGLTLEQSVEADATFNGGDGGGSVLLSEYMLGMSIWPIGNASIVSNASVSSGANKLIAILFMLPSNITISTVVFEVTTAQASSNVGVGWYDVDKNLVFETGAVASTSTGAKRTTLANPISLDSGMYWLAWTSDKTTVGVRGVSAANVAFFNVFNSGTRRYGVGTGGASGVLPATLPALSDPASTEHPIFSLFELVS